MSQSVDFLRVLPKKTSKLSALIIGLVTAGIVSLLILSSIFTAIKQISAHYQLQTAQEKVITAQKQYDALAKAYPLLASDSPLVNQVKELSEKAQIKRDEVKNLETLLLRRGFSEYMYGLAQAAPSTLWVNQLTIQHHPVAATISGYTLSSEMVSDLMSRLMKTEAYAEIVFNLFLIKTIKNRPYARFSISTTALGPDKALPVDETELEIIETKDK